MNRLPGKMFKKVFLLFLVIALCQFGHWELEIKIPQNIIASSFKHGQLVEDDE